MKKYDIIRTWPVKLPSKYLINLSVSICNDAQKLASNIILNVFNLILFYFVDNRNYEKCDR